MNSHSEKFSSVCPKDEIAAYIDGELRSHEEIEFERHLAECDICKKELNSQKKVSTTLEILLEKELKEIDVPEDFSRVVAANAESSVSGMRDPGERSKAFWVCAVLVFLVVIGLGTELTGYLGAVNETADQSTAVGGLLFHTFYDALTGVFAILRNLSHRYVFNSVASFVLVVVFFVSASIAISQMVYRYTRW